MTDKYDSNEDYGSYGENAKRKSAGDKGPDSIDLDNDESNPANNKAGEYVRELLAEKISIDQNKLPNATRLIDQEISKTQQIGKAPLKEVKYVDIYREKPIKVTVKVLVPVREHPKFNFVGKLLGPKGNSMKRLQEETMCKMAVLGRGSMKDRQKEEELRNSLDPKYSHLSDDLHVEISALGPPAEAHARVAFALAEVRKYLIPDNNDNIRQEQMREMEIMTSVEPPPEERRERRTTSSILRYEDEPSIPGPMPRPVRPNVLGRVINPHPPVSRSVLRQGPAVILHSKSSEPASVSLARPSLSMRSASRTPVSTPRVMPAKTKIMSILDRARIAMEESYGYDDDPYEPSSPAYEPVYTSSVSHSRGYSSSAYHDADYDSPHAEYYRESSSSSYG
ncbi:unnamed protein product [Brassicogethes aeneus]|uniref:K Homology domain-containing protein n=1 Tax=Brassicogethes aeneus TaxID=1431903 RepID=A0A9P0AYP8_BRAAE|nr:unnamed protein product [Brassicogethes aeneus]